MGFRGLRARQCLAIGCLLLAPIAITAPRSAVPGCTLVPPAYTIIGPLVATKGSTATFSIDSLEREADSFGDPPALAPGQTVAVRFKPGQTKFLAIGYRYRVEVIWTGSDFYSNIYVAGRECQGAGTRYSDMREIDVPPRHRSWVLPVAIAAVIGVGAVIAGFFVRRSRRSRSGRAAG